MHNKNIKSILSIFIAIVMVISLPMVNVSAVETVKLNKTTLTLAEGTTSNLKVNGAKTVKWSTSDEEIAAVSNKGVVTGITVGSAVITANADGVKLTCNVTVSANKIKVQYSTTCVYKGDTTTIKLSAKGIDDLVCTSSDKTIATAKIKQSEKTIEIKGIGKGFATIKLYSKSNKTLYRNITVKVYPNISYKKTLGTFNDNVLTNDYFGLKVDISSYAKNPDIDIDVDLYEDSRYSSRREDEYDILYVESDTWVTGIVIMDEITVGESFGINTEMDHSKFIDLFLNANAYDFYADSIKTSQIKIAGKTFDDTCVKFSFCDIFYNDGEFDDTYIHIMTYKRDNYFMVILTISFDEDISSEFISHFSAI